MQITEVRVFPVDEEKLKAYASIVLDACFIVNDSCHRRGRGLFITCRPGRNAGGYRDVRIAQQQTRRMIGIVCRREPTRPRDARRACGLAPRRILPTLAVAHRRRAAGMLGGSTPSPTPLPPPSTAAAPARKSSRRTTRLFGA